MDARYGKVAEQPTMQAAFERHCALEQRFGRKPLSRRAFEKSGKWSPKATRSNPVLIDRDMDAINPEQDETISLTASQLEAIVSRAVSNALTAVQGAEVVEVEAPAPVKPRRTRRTRNGAFSEGDTFTYVKSGVEWTVLGSCKTKHGNPAVLASNGERESKWNAALLADMLKDGRITR